MRQPGKGNRPKSPYDTIAPVKRDAEPLRCGFRNRTGDGRLTDKSPALDLKGDFHGGHYIMASEKTYKKPHPWYYLYRGFYANIRNDR
jgi:hypothetical protein